MKSSQLIFLLFTAPILALANTGQPEETAAKDITIEEYLQQKSSIPGVVGRKDPFIRAEPPFSVTVNKFTDEVIPTNPVLERYPLKDYSVIAVLVNPENPRALVRTPDKKVYILKEKDKLGSRGGVVTKISRQGVTILQSTRSPLGFVDKTEVNIAVGSKTTEGQGASAAPGGK